MCYTTARGEELSVASFPTWDATLGLLDQKYPPVEMESFPIVPDEYLLQIAWVRIPPNPHHQRSGIRGRGSGDVPVP